MKRKKPGKSNNTRIAVAFIGVVAFILAVSLIFKAAVIIGQGRFRGDQRFTISIANNNDLKIASFSPIAKNISVIDLDRKLDEKDARQFLGIPIDGFINDDSLDLNQSIDSLFLKTTLSYANLQTNLTIIDIVRLFIFTKSVSNSSIDSKEISANLSASDIDGIVSESVSDELIKKDNVTIQIVNGTNVSGLGGRLARLITNMGGDVIIVTTSDVPQKASSILYSGEKSYTIERLSKVLGFKIIESKLKNISDITIIIGEESLSSTVF